MRLFALVVFCSSTSFVLGGLVERHLAGDELVRLNDQVGLVVAQVETLQIRCASLEREASELKMRAKTFLPNVDHL